MALLDQWIRQGEAFLCVYAINSKESFEQLPLYIKTIYKVKDWDLPPEDTYPQGTRRVRLRLVKKKREARTVKKVVEKGKETNQAFNVPVQFVLSLSWGIRWIWIIASGRSPPRKGRHLRRNMEFSSLKHLPKRNKT